MSKATWEDTPFYRRLLARLKRDMPSGGLPGLTPVGQTPNGDPGLIDGRGGWLDVKTSVDGVQSGLELGLGGGEVGNVVTQVNGFAQPDGGTTGLLGLYNSDADFLYEGDAFLDTAVFQGNSAHGRVRAAVYGAGTSGSATLTSEISVTSGKVSTSGVLAGDTTTLVLSGSDLATLTVDAVGTQDDPALRISRQGAPMVEVSPNGDLEILDSAAGVILTDSAGGKHRIKVATNGTLSTEAVT